MNLSKLKSVYYILPICSVICILMTGLNSIHWNDDFNYLENIDKYGFFKEATIQYFTWDGRVISPLFMIRNILLYYFLPQVLVILALCSIFITSYLICRIIEKLEIVKIPKNIIYNITIIGGLLLWISYKAHLGRSVYWATGSYYQFANMLIFLWTYLYLKRKILLIPFLLLTLTVISTGVNISMLLIIIMFLLHVFKFKTIIFNKDSPVLVTILLAFVLSTFAPGNFNRAEKSLTSGIDLHLSHFINNFWVVLKEYLLMSKSLFIAAIIFGVLLNTSVQFVVLRKKAFWIAIIFLVGGISSIAPFVFVSQAASKHTSIHFQTCLFIFISLSVLLFINYAKIVFPKWIFLALINLTSLYFCYVAIIQYQIGRSVRAQIESRYDYLETKRNSSDTIFLKTINQSDSFFTNRIWDIKNHPDDCNKILQRHFQTGPILPMKK
jgi:hypothetical protein